MHWKPTSRSQLRLANLLFVALFLGAIGLLHWIGQRYHFQYDWTQNKTNSLSPASIAALERLSGPVQITAYATRGSELRQLIERFIARFQRYKPDISLEFVDVDVEPERVQKANIQYDGELLLTFGDARENIPPAALNEENFTNALTRLGKRGERWLVFVAGHGERSADRQANFDLSLWAGELRKRGFQTRTLSVAETDQIPQNTSVLIIAGPRVDLSPAEIKKIESFVSRGGNLLWLGDPDALHGLERIAEMLGIEFQPGVVVDPASAYQTGVLDAVAITRYSNHPAVKNFQFNTYFLKAAALTMKPPEGWKGSQLFDTPPTAWSETDPGNSNVKYDKGKDIPGPLVLGVALTRTLESREQRVVVVGDGDFLSNRFVYNGGNLELGTSLTNWLAQDDAYVNIPIRTARDRTVDVTYATTTTIVVVFVIALPLLLLGSGVTVWWRRRRR